MSFETCRAKPLFTHSIFSINANFFVVLHLIINHQIKTFDTFEHVTVTLSFNMKLFTVEVTLTVVLSSQDLEMLDRYVLL